MKNSARGVILALWLIVECVDAKKYCWYFEGGYPIYFICRSYEDCCGTRCCVRALSVQRLWYFWLLLMMGVLLCCGAGFFIRRRMYPSSLSEEPSFNVSFTRHPCVTQETSLLHAAHVRTPTISTCIPLLCKPARQGINISSDGRTFNPCVRGVRKAAGRERSTAPVRAGSAIFCSGLSRFCLSGYSLVIKMSEENADAGCLSLSLSLSPSPAHSLTHTHTHTDMYTHLLIHTHSHTPTLSHTHIHTHTETLHVHCKLHCTSTVNTELSDSAALSLSVHQLSDCKSAVTYLSSSSTVYPVYSANTHTGRALGVFGRVRSTHRTGAGGFLGGLRYELSWFPKSFQFDLSLRSLQIFSCPNKTLALVKRFTMLANLKFWLI
ncbi:uncharacterized protein LOC135260665 isoform X2 [Anguilla rostrata]|uniref:uncharacterized protein LOC135260665 isoform X2 n=1 Tax=Anguilla rostrata TaxID=7938 RepID=UPI0030CE578B